MASTITCPRCGASLQVGNVLEGESVPCPRCQERVAAPPGTEPTRPCPECGQLILAAARKCRHCKAWLDEDDDAEVYRTSYQPCPRCGAKGATRVLFTFWGSFYGPALFNHVRCPRCSYAYNGKTGRSNLIPVILFVSVPLALILAIVAGVFFLVIKGLGG
jgi:DNA-directed RNA polymerase subunit RPC12/RpoP